VTSLPLQPLRLAAFNNYCVRIKSLTTVNIVNMVILTDWIKTLLNGVLLRQRFTHEQK